jgi:hypothetical protein
MSTSKLLGGLDAYGFARLNGSDLALESYVDSAIAALSFDNVVESAETSIADYVTANGTGIAEGTLLILNNAASGARQWVRRDYATSNVGTTDDFINIDGGSFTAADLTNEYAGSDGIFIDDTNGFIGINDGTITQAKLHADLVSAISEAAGAKGNITGDGVSTSLAFTHNAGTKDVVFTVRDVDTDEFVAVTTVATDVNTLTFTFASAPANGKQYAVTVKRVS